MPGLFVAIDIPERIRDEIADTYAAIPGAKWVNEQQIHITLRFIGEVDNPTQEQIAKALQYVTTPSFDLNLKGVGFFPPHGDPRVLWVGISENPILLRLQSKIERTLTELGLKGEDRKFHPHLTVARLSDSPHERIARFLTDNSLFETDQFAVSEFHLYESVLRREGPLHMKVASYPLRSEWSV